MQAVAYVADGAVSTPHQSYLKLGSPLLIDHLGPSRPHVEERVHETAWPHLIALVATQKHKKARLLSVDAVRLGQDLGV
jgi:hypothetical protein